MRPEPTRGGQLHDEEVIATRVGKAIQGAVGETSPVRAEQAPVDPAVRW